VSTNFLRSGSKGVRKDQSQTFRIRLPNFWALTLATRGMSRALKSPHQEWRQTMIVELNPTQKSCMLQMLLLDAKPGIAT